MNGYFYPQKGSDDRASIQSALDSAALAGRGTVILTGEWNVDGTLYISDHTTLLFDGATLGGKGGVSPLLTNSNRLLPRGKTLFGTGRGISVIGNGKILGTVDLVNTEDLLISGICFEGEESGVILSYSSGGRIINLEFNRARRCILAGIGTRNCYFENLRTEGEEESIVFSSDRMSDRVVNYFGPDVNNNIVRGLSSRTPVRIIGEYCRDILITP